MKCIIFLVFFMFNSSLACRKRCDDGWTSINRTLGAWCVKVIPATSFWNMTVAENTCNELGAVLSSVESESELEIEMSLANNLNMTFTYLGSKLKPECDCHDYVNGCNSTSTCTPQTSFEWTDNFTVGTTMLSESNNYSYQDSLYYQFLVLFYIGIYDATGLQIQNIVNFTTSQIGNVGALCGKQAA